MSNKTAYEQGYLAALEKLAVSPGLAREALVKALLKSKSPVFLPWDDTLKQMTKAHPRTARRALGANTKNYAPDDVRKMVVEGSGRKLSPNKKYMDSTIPEKARETFLNDAANPAGLKERVNAFWD